MNNRGIVYLVGAGPGDPGLITLRGMNLINSADVIVIDRLANRTLVAETKAKIIFAGKRMPKDQRGRRLDMAQDVINRLLVRLARSGKKVVRLKGGDPVVFGRGSEELEALVKNKIPFEVVPGITSAIAVPAYAGIPITDRQFSSKVSFVTGHEAAGGRVSRVDWQKIPPNETVVILMGVVKWPIILNGLLKSGWPKNKPVAAIERGTTSRQKVVLTTLENSKKEFLKMKVKPPAIIVVGDVAKLNKKYSWVKKRKPLLGKKIVLTRSLDQVREFKEELEEKGADVLLCPSIQIEPLLSSAEVRFFFSKYKTNEKEFDWIIFLSANAVRVFSDGWNRFGLKNKPDAALFAVGPKTGEAIKALGWNVTAQAAAFNSQGVVQSLGPVKGKKILMPRPAHAPKKIVASLRRKGALVEELSIYRTCSASPPSPWKKEIFRVGVDAITFTSASAVHHFLSFFKKSEIKQIFSRAKPISIGSMTSRALRQYGLFKPLQAKISTTKGISELLCRKLGMK